MQRMQGMDGLGGGLPLRVDTKFSHARARTHKDPRLTQPG